MELKIHKNHEECTEILKKALELSNSGFTYTVAITQLGKGWVAEEALAISIYCALKYRDDYKKELITAVIHGGDSDSTGAITGNILGSYLGLSNIPSEWVENVELSESILKIADDLIITHQHTNEWWNRYPGY
jgi:ADP-ribosylglycohydrolase